MCENKQSHFSKVSGKLVPQVSFITKLSNLYLLLFMASGRRFFFWVRCSRQQLVANLIFYFDILRCVRPPENDCKTYFTLKEKDHHTIKRWESRIIVWIIVHMQSTGGIGRRIRPTRYKCVMAIAGRSMLTTFMGLIKFGELLRRGSF